MNEYTHCNNIINCRKNQISRVSLAWPGVLNGLWSFVAIFVFDLRIFKGDCLLGSNSVSDYVWKVDYVLITYPYYTRGYPWKNGASRASAERASEPSAERADRASDRFSADLVRSLPFFRQTFGSLAPVFPPGIWLARSRFSARHLARSLPLFRQTLQ